MLIRTATAPKIDDERVLDDLMKTEGWMTLMTFAREAARKLYTLLACRPGVNARVPYSETAIECSAALRFGPCADGHGRHTSRCI